MDRDFGSKPGSGGAASAQNEAIDRRERLRRLALETIDLAKDPYFMRNHLGSYECKLCLTLHNNEGNYLAHTQGKRHQQNLAQRAAREAQEAPVLPQPNRRKVDPRKTGPCHCCPRSPCRLLPPPHTQEAGAGGGGVAVAKMQFLLVLVRWQLHCTRLFSASLRCFLPCWCVQSRLGDLGTE